MLSQEYPEVSFVLAQVEPEYDLFQRIRIGNIDAAVLFNPYIDLPDYLEILYFWIVSPKPDCLRAAQSF